MYDFMDKPVPPPGIAQGHTRTDEFFRGVRSGQCFFVPKAELMTARQRALRWLENHYPQSGRLVTRKQPDGTQAGLWLFFDEREGKDNDHQ